MVLTTNACAPSLSASVAVTLTDGRPAEATAIVQRTVESVSASSDADRVTFCGVCQFDGVNVSVPPVATVTLVSPAPAVKVTVTLAVGWSLQPYRERVVAALRNVHRGRVDDERLLYLSTTAGPRR